MNIDEIRRARLRQLMKEHGQANLAKMLGYQQGTFLSQMTGPKSSRKITEKTARGFEEKLNLPSGHLDRMEDAPAPEPAMDNVNLVADVIRLVGTIQSEEKVELPPAKFADVVAMAYVDMMEHGQRPRPEHIKRLVRLLK